jgi:hypothetical protein
MMMVNDVRLDVNLFVRLAEFDRRFAEKTRKQRCPFCGRPLCAAPYQRNPRGLNLDLPSECLTRHSLCCSGEGCRKRVLPPSCLFLGRKVHWACIILLALAIQYRDRKSAEKVCLLLDLPLRTVMRWCSFFKRDFPVSTLWLQLRGLVSAAVSDQHLPGALLDVFVSRLGSEREGLLACLVFLAGAPAS